MRVVTWLSFHRELLNLLAVNRIDFRRLTDVTEPRIKLVSPLSRYRSLTTALLTLNSFKKKSIQPTIDAAWSHGTAECQVKLSFHEMIRTLKSISHMKSPC